MKHPLIVAALAGLVASAAMGQVLPAPQNVLQLAADGTVEVQQDLLVLAMSTTREGSDSNAVQAQLKVALDAALAEARKTAQPQQMDVRTGNFSLAPRYAQNGRIASWQGSAELVLEGRDFARITEAAGRVQSLTVASTRFGLSREQRLRVEGDAQTLAIERFKAKAAQLAKDFGFGGYSLREVSVSSSDSSPGPLMRMQSAAISSSSSDTPVPVQAGKSAVTVTVSGSVQLR